VAIALFWTLLVWPANAAASADTQAAPPQPGSEATSDRLAEPVPSNSPTQVERGRSVYYYHCMPCHGDRGQGLTDEFRAVWEPDHRNCWARGCHTGKAELAAFYIPREVPAVAGAPAALGGFPQTDALFSYVRQTQPPQRPGALTDAEYWDVTAFLLEENGRSAEVSRLAAGAPGPANCATCVLAMSALPLLALAAAGHPDGVHERKD